MDYGRAENDVYGYLVFCDDDQRSSLVGLVHGWKEGYSSHKVMTWVMGRCGRWIILDLMDLVRGGRSIIARYER
jgi:hypothetical protein